MAKWTFGQVCAQRIVIGLGECFVTFIWLQSVNFNTLWSLIHLTSYFRRTLSPRSRGSFAPRRVSAQGCREIYDCIWDIVLLVLRNSHATGLSGNSERRVPSKARWFLCCQFVLSLCTSPITLAFLEYSKTKCCDGETRLSLTSSKFELLEYFINTV